MKHNLAVLALLFATAAPASADGASPLEGPTRAEAALPEGATPGWWSQVTQGIEEEQHAIAWREADAARGMPAAHRGVNPGQGFETAFTADGILVIPRGEQEAEWSFSLGLLRWGRPGDLRTASPAAPSPAGSRVEYSREGLVEWFVNEARGLEHGYTIPAPPPGPRGGLVFDLRLGGSLRPVFAGDGTSVDLYAEGAVSVLRYGKLVVRDAAGMTLPAALQSISGGIRIAIDDAEAIYPVTVDPLLTGPAWTAESNQANANFGMSVATAGDVNGDGYSDVIVGAQNYDNVESNEGRAYLYLGAAAGLSAAAAWTAESNQANANFGVSVATAGDVNGDGYSDLIVGAYLYDNVESDEGRAYLYLGSASGLSVTAAWTAESNQASALFGSSVATAGDVNGDGYSDVIVGAYLYDNVESDEGRAYVYLGSSSGLSATAAWTAESNQASANLGYSVATAGDVTGDGFSDVIVGAYQYDNVELSEGRAYLYLGSFSGLSATAAWTAESDQAFAYFGVSAATAGDVNGDGYSDVIVGAQQYDNVESNEGRAYLYLGSTAGLSATAAWTAESDQATALFGVSVATAGDVNGDGYSDVIVGAYQYDNVESNEGRAFLYLGSASGLSATAAWTAESNQASTSFGVSVATAGDVNGDGYSDVIVGAHQYDNVEAGEGSAFLYLGSAAGPAATAAWTAESDQASAFFGNSVATAGDVNGDGYSDVIVGAYLYDNVESDEGRAYLYLGSASGLSVTAAWTAESNQASALFGSSVATAGDVNGDGYSDVIVGAYFYDNVEASEGRAYLYLGSASGLSATAAWTAESNQANALFGYSVAAAGDVNGDGYSDVIVGAYQYDNVEANEGRAFLYLGSSSGLSATAAWTAESNQASACFGYSVAAAGDLNGDGYSDVIVGAYLYDNVESNEGRAYLYLGSAAGLSTTAAWTAESNQASASFGYSVATAGDLNGDGYSDVIVGAYLYDNVESNEGRAYLYLGSAAGLSTTAAWTAESNQASAFFGSSVATAGDVNGDGYSDVIVGAYGYDNVEASEGRAYLYLGSAAGLSATAAWTAESDQASALFGESVAAAGDVNGDGYSDVIVGAYQYDNVETNEGRSYLYLGNEGGYAVLPRQLRADLSAPIAPLGLAYQYQLRLGLRLRSPLGRDLVRLEWQVAPLGGSFDVVSNPIQRDASWWNGGPSGFDRKALVALPSQPGPYMWRARAAYFTPRSPFQSHGPWFTQPFNGLRETDVLGTLAAPPPACVVPDERVWLYQVTLSVPQGYPILHFQDPNQPNQRTGYHVRRSDDPVPPKSTWPLIATNIVDMDAGTPNIQWTDSSGAVPPSGTWYYQVTAFNALCPAEGPF